MPILLTLPLVAALWLANRLFYPRNLVQPVVEMLALNSIYMAGMFSAYRTHRAFHIAEVAGLTDPRPSEPPTQAVVWVEYQGEQ